MGLHCLLCIDTFCKKLLIIFLILLFYQYHLDQWLSHGRPDSQTVQQLPRGPAVHGGAQGGGGGRAAAAGEHPCQHQGQARPHTPLHRSGGRQCVHCQVSSVPHQH